MRYFCFIIFLATILSQNCVAQIQFKPSSLHTFLQKNADTTFILSYESGWVEPPDYKILSKKGDTISIYEYKSLYKNKYSMPKAIRDTFYKIQKFVDFSKSYNVGINEFFKPKFIDSEYARKFWEQMNNKKPWALKSVSDWKCGNEKIYDGVSITLDLISKEKIIHLSFFAPKYFEAKCPFNKELQTVLNIEKLFETYFK